MIFNDQLREMVSTAVLRQNILRYNQSNSLALSSSLRSLVSVWTQCILCNNPCCSLFGVEIKVEYFERGVPALSAYLANATSLKQNNKF